MTTKYRYLIAGATIWLSYCAHAAPSWQNSNAVLPSSPFKEQNMPDTGVFNPAAPVTASSNEPHVAPAAQTYYKPAVVIDGDAHQAKPYALVASPTLPCAPAYCPRRVRVDRN